MNIRIIGIDGLGGHEVKRIFSTLTDFDFIKTVRIREFNNQFNNPWDELLNIYDVTIEIEPDRDDYVSIHVFDNSIYIVDGDSMHDVITHIDRSVYERVEII